MLNRNSQMSVEYMIIIGFVTVITIPLLIIYYTFTQDSKEDISSAQIDQIAKTISDSAESVYYFGEPSQTNLKINIPDNVVLSNLSNNEIVFRIKTRTGEADIVQSTLVNITGSLPVKKGAYTVTIKAKSNYVNVSYK